MGREWPYKVIVLTELINLYSQDVKHSLSIMMTVESSGGEERFKPLGGHREGHRGREMAMCPNNDLSV